MLLKRVPVVVCGVATKECDLFIYCGVSEQSDNAYNNTNYSRFT